MNKETIYILFIRPLICLLVSIFVTYLTYPYIVQYFLSPYFQTRTSRFGFAVLYGMPFAFVIFIFYKLPEELIENWIQKWKWKRGAPIVEMIKKKLAEQCKENHQKLMQLESEILLSHVELALKYFKVDSDFKVFIFMGLFPEEEIYEGEFKGYSYTERLTFEIREQNYSTSSEENEILRKIMP